MFVVDSRMENGKSSKIYLDMRTTPSPEQLGGLIDHAKSKGLNVVLMPIVLLDNPSGTEWRGVIHPEDWTYWWSSYGNMLWHYAKIAEEHKADVFVVGSELVSTESKAEEWQKTIAMIRRHFHGMITYSSNWDHYHDIPFWEQLDFIGMNSYWKLGEDHNVSVGHIHDEWRKIQKNVMGFANKKHKPLVLLEAGWSSMANAADEPWDYTRDEVPLDLDLQKKLYEGFFSSWYGVPNFGGFMMWEWPPHAGGLDSRSYTPRGKPAEQVLKEWLAKPWGVAAGATALDSPRPGQ